MKYYFAEPEFFLQFYPLTLNRFVGELVLGCMSLKERLATSLGKDLENISLRQELFGLQKEKSYKGFIFYSHVIWKTHGIKERIDENTVLKDSQGNIIAFYADSFSHEQIYDQKFLTDFLKGKKEIVLEEDSPYAYGVIYNIVELLSYHNKLLTQEIFDYLHISVMDKLEAQNPLDHYEVKGDPPRLFIKPTASISAHVAFDVSKGPILIEDEAEIGALSFIEGPCFIGKKVKILQAKVREGCSFMKGCKIGGEIEKSLFLEYSNKAHDGYVGHSYIGRFVNFGALSTTSDLKNNYHPISVQYEKELKIETQLLKVGSFIGDFSTLAIGTLLNTGAMVGVGSNIFNKGGDGISATNIPAFTWGRAYNGEKYRFKEFIENIKMIMARREQILSKQEEDVLKSIYDREA
jgi:UDP-N-acetylglucosamine diphosphorylase/glucosamine-1-phosphate N-acetyltransferase